VGFPRLPAREFSIEGNVAFFRLPEPGSFEDPLPVTPEEKERFFEQAKLLEGNYDNILVTTRLSEGSLDASLPVFISANNDARSMVTWLNYLDRNNPSIVTLKVVGVTILYYGTNRPEVVAHELAHTFGLPDRYFESTRLPHAGYEKHLMGSVCCGHRLNKADFLDSYRMQQQGKLLSPIKIREVK
jgi:hypothetical protein